MLHQSYTALLGFWTPGPWEFAVLAVLGVLIFGKRLPEVGRSIGRGIVEFKRGLAGVADDEPGQTTPQQQPRLEQKPTGTEATGTAEKAPESQDKAGGPA